MHAATEPPTKITQWKYNTLPLTHRYRICRECGGTVDCVDEYGGFIKRRCRACAWSGGGHFDFWPAFPLAAEPDKRLLVGGLRNEWRLRNGQAVTLHDGTAVRLNDVDHLEVVA
jgi:hypothetical protein